MFLITRAFENQQYTWKPICWHKCSNKAVNFQLTLSIIGRKHILTWPLSRLIQFTVILLQSSSENAVCRFRHCESRNSKFLTHATKPSHRQWVYKMILWKNSNSKDIEEIFICLQNVWTGEKLTQLPAVKALPCSEWCCAEQPAGQCCERENALFSGDSP